MTVHRTEIELALEVMVRNQRGIDFQHLATQLATQTYPSLVPTEWFHDGGEDAITAPIIGDDRVKRSLACSLTGTWDKVSKDCERIASRGVTIDLLIFFTAVAVTNIQIENWRKQVREKYKHDLDVVGKVRIVSSLERPENAWLCRDYLGLTSADEPDLETLRQRVRKVAVATLSNWKADYGFDPQRQIELTLTLKEPAQDQRRFLTLQSCCDNIRRARKVILTGVPGAGKTVTLLQIAEKLLEESETPIPLVVSLAEWADSNLALLNFLAQRPSCQAVGLSESDLSRLVTAGRLIFLLNGWNEVSDVATEHAFRSLRGLIADCPATAFVIATRETAVTPPLTNPANIHIERLETHQRRAIIHKADLSGPATLIQTIEHQPALEEITRIPLFLSGVIKLARQGKNIPGSKYGILRELVDSTESHPDHKAALFGGPCKGQHKSYLVQIAASMCSNGTTTVGSQELLSSIGACSKNLLGEGLIGSMPDARSVVASLISHHLLVSLDGPTQGSIRFAHQQFQEWFAGEWLYLRFVGIFNAHDQNAVLDFQKQILNNPFWEEPLKFLAERLNPSSGFESRSDYADHLIRWLIPVDLIFAAQLARLVGWRTLTKGRNELAAAARSLYARTEPVSKQFGLVVMLATGSPDFLDIFEPLIENENDQIRLAFYSALEPFPLSCLGDDWHVKLSRWCVSR